MNPAMLIIAGCAIVIIWFLSAKFYKVVGGKVKDVAEKAIDEIKEE